MGRSSSALKASPPPSHGRERSGQPNISTPRRLRSKKRKKERPAASAETAAAWFRVSGAADPVANGSITWSSTREVRIRVPVFW